METVGSVELSIEGAAVAVFSHTVIKTALI